MHKPWMGENGRPPTEPAALAEVRRENLELQARLAGLSRELAESQVQLVEFGRQLCRLANLYVAGRRLLETGDRAEALATIGEILTNLVGVAQLAVYERAANGIPTLVASVGLDPARVPLAELDGGVVGSVIRTGEPFYAPAVENAATDTDPLACIPLRRRDGLAGAIVIYRLLSHKPSLDELDRELFDLLATDAAEALARAGRDQAGVRTP